MRSRFRGYAIATAVVAVSLLAWYGLGAVDPRGRLSLVVFAAAGALIAWFNERAHRAEAAQRTAAAESSARLERLDAILNTTIDGVIVIDAKGRIEGFNRGAERLFGYPQAEVLGRNVSLLMPSPHQRSTTPTCGAISRPARRRSSGRAAR